MEPDKYGEGGCARMAHPLFLSQSGCINHDGTPQCRYPHLITCKFGVNIFGWFYEYHYLCAQIQIPANMYKTIRMLPALLLLALGTACTNDLATAPATGNPLVLEDVYIGTQTKAEPYEPGFADGSTLEATLTLGDVTSTGTYEFNGTTWESTTPAYWHSGKEAHALTLRTPEPDPAMPDAFTADNWHQYNILTYTNTQVTPGTTSFQLTHTRAQLIVTLTPGKGLEDADLSTATVEVVDGCGMMAYNNAYYALIDPTATSPELAISYDGETYPYKEDIPLTANQCTHLTLALHKTGVSGISTTSQDWQSVTTPSQLEEGWTVIHCNGGDLTIPADATNLKLLITGTLTSSDMDIINDAKNRITDLYITATAEDNKAWDDFDMGRAVNLQSAYIAQATSIGSYTFEYVDALTSISLPKATTIGGDAFYCCTSLTNISLPEATTIESGSFEGCTALTTVSLPNAETIEDYAFEDCTELTTISLSKNAKDNIGEDAFYNCYLLTTLHLLDLTAEEFKADPEKYTSFGGHDWQHIYYNGGEWHRDANN